MPVFENDEGRASFLELIEDALKRFNRSCHACRQMGNRCHLLAETVTANLSLGMRHINGVYT
ncbi:MAG: hypothetical protein AB9866_25825 [Syntrophobacteraceae bacterium]